MTIVYSISNLKHIMDGITTVANKLPTFLNYLHKLIIKKKKQSNLYSLMYINQFIFLNF